MTENQRRAIWVHSAAMGLVLQAWRIGVPPEMFFPWAMMVMALDDEQRARRLLADIEIRIQDAAEVAARDDARSRP
jgi:hypothetical protein